MKVKAMYSFFVNSVATKSWQFCNEEIKEKPPTNDGCSVLSAKLSISKYNFFFFALKNFNHESWRKFCLDIHATSKKIRLNR